MPALQGVSFTMERGECVAILGQNGSGKSTLVRLLSTLLINDGGEARIFGHDAFKETRAVQRLVNRVSVEASFFKKMSAAENLSYAARFYGMGPAETRVKIPEILERVGFPADRRGESMENLSRGMQQKVALARALLTSPVLLLLDEPTTGLDPRSKLEVQEFIKEVRIEHDATILLCTHDMLEAESLADRVGLLDRGELLFLEPVDAGEEALRRRDARGGVLRRDGSRVRGRGRRGRRDQGGVRMSALAATVRSELIGLGGIVERNVYLTKRYFLWDARVHGVDDREHAHDRLHRACGRSCRPATENTARDEPARRRGHLGLPRDHLRVRHGDGRLGALGRDDRVHVHGSAVAFDAPVRHGRVRGAATG